MPNRLRFRQLRPLERLEPRIAPGVMLPWLDFGLPSNLAIQPDSSESVQAALLTEPSETRFAGEAPSQRATPIEQHPEQSHHAPNDVTPSRSNASVHRLHTSALLEPFAPRWSAQRAASPARALPYAAPSASHLSALPGSVGQATGDAHTPAARARVATANATPAPANLPVSFAPRARGTGSQLLVDAQGQPLEIDADDPNTLVVAAATWCGWCAEFEATLATPEIQAATEGLRIVLAYTNEGGNGPGGVVHPEVLENLPVESAFLAPGSVQPNAFPRAYNPATGHFDNDAWAAIDSWIQAGESKTSGGLKSSSDFSNNDSASATDCGCGFQRRDEPTVAALLGDNNDDTYVDAADLALWQLGYGVDDQGDADEDGDSDGADFLQWQRRFGTQVIPPGEFSILTPEGLTPDTMPTIAWGASDAAENYKLTLYDDAALTNSVLSAPGLTTTEYTPAELPSGEYFVAVTANNADGSTDATDNGQSFSVATSYHRVFVTSGAKGISSNTALPPANANFFGGLDQADWVCTFHAFQAGLPGTATWDFVNPIYQAVLSDSNTDAFDRLNISAPLFLTDDALVASSKADMFDGSLNAAINKDELGNSIASNTNVWTGTNSSGAYAGADCSLWTSSSGSVSGDIGNLSTSSFSWINTGSRTCNQTARLYCVSPVIHQ